MSSEASHTKQQLPVFPIVGKADVYVTVRTEPSGLFRLILDSVGASFFH